MHRLAAGDAGRLHLEPALLGLRDRALGVDRHTERVDDAAEQPVADRNGEDAPGRGDRHALFDVFGVAEDDGTDRLFFEVQRETLCAAFELEQLVDRRVGQAGDARDAVTDDEDAPDALPLDRRVEPFDLLLQDRSDVRRS